MQTNTVDKNSPEYLQKRINTARTTVLVITILTLVNLLMLVLDAGRYFPFSVAVPYYLTSICMGISYAMTGSYFGTATTIALVISAVIVVAYFVFWLMSKKHVGWLIAALVLFSLDTLVLLLLGLGLDMLVDSILDIAFHVLAIIELAQAISANQKLKALDSPNMPTYGPEQTYTGPEF